MTKESTYDLQACIAACRQCHDVCVQTLSYCIEQDGRHVQPTHIRLLPILDRDKRLTGIVSLGDLAMKTGAGEQGEIAVTLETISQAPPGGGGRREPVGAGSV